MDAAGVEALRRRRDAARNRFVVAMLLLFLFGSGLSLAGAKWGGVFPVTYLLLALLASVAVTLAHWLWRGFLLRRATDPWAYDPELDGPIAQELEGRSFGPPQAGRRNPRLVALGVAAAVALGAVGSWLAQAAGARWDSGNGAVETTVQGYLLLCAALGAFVAAAAALWVGLALRPQA